MQTLHITLKPLDNNYAELRYWHDLPANYERQVLQLQVIEDLLEQNDLDYDVLRPDLKTMGQRLFRWLDGDGRWLNRAISECTEEGIVLAISSEAKLSYLPWEVLHDGTQFLMEREYPLIVPVRWINQPSSDRLPQSRPLQILFMATSPENVQPVLDFEHEEATILRVTQDLPLTLRVEESGCIPELSKLWMRYPDNTFDVFHLTGHASVQSQHPYTPYFITESLIGDQHETNPLELLKIFQVRRPRLIFLSGCRTGQAKSKDSVPSFAEALVRQGLPAVLAWGRPISDLTATEAAAFLYERLAAGEQLVQGLSLTYRFLFQKQMKGWHSLRLYVRGNAWGALVEPPGDYVPPPESVQYQFLDAEQKIRVAAPEQFVGRRRTIQRCLRALRESRVIGILLYGLGGVGKSSTAARLVERLPDYQPLVIHQHLDAQTLEGMLFRQCTSEVGQGILNSQLPLMQRLAAFLNRGLNQPNQKMMIVLDDFEANLEMHVDGSQGLRSDVVKVLMALLQAIVQCGKPHRVLITSRYDIRLPELDERLHREPLAALQGADLQKKCDRLPSFQPQAAINPALQKQARTVADGNPRLLEWLDCILQDKQVNTALILDKLNQQAIAFRQSLAVWELIKQQDEALRMMLRRGLVFDLPVPTSIMTAIWSTIPDWEQKCEQAIALGLLECTPSTAAPSLRNYHISSSSKAPSDDLLRVPRILPLSLPTDSQSLYSEAVRVLYSLWRSDSTSKKEEKFLEIYRLAMIAENEDIAADICAELSNLWNSRGQFQSVIDLGIKTLKIIKEPRLKMITLFNTARAYNDSGQSEKAIQFYEESKDIANQTQNDQCQFMEALVGNLGCCYLNLGRIVEAINCFEQALKISKSLSDQNLQKFWHNNLGVSYCTLGKHDEAIFHYEEAINLAIQLHDRETEGTCYGNLCDCYGLKGQVSCAIDYARQAITIQDEIQDLEGKLTTLHSLSEILIDENNYADAIDVAILGLDTATNSAVCIPKLMSEIYSVIACAQMYQDPDKLTEAWANAINAQQYDVLQNNHYVSLLLGLISAQQGNLVVANKLFRESIGKSNDLIIAEKHNFKALDIKFIAVCGMALSEPTSKITQSYILEASEVYSQSRSINSDYGVIQRTNRLFNYLRAADSENILLSIQQIIM